MKVKYEVYFSLPFDRLVQKKIPELINLILPEGFLVIDVDANSGVSTYSIAKVGDKTACARINYFWSSGPMLRFTINSTGEGEELLNMMKTMFKMDDFLLLTI